MTNQIPQNRRTGNAVLPALAEFHRLLAYDEATGLFTRRVSRGGKPAGTRAGHVHKGHGYVEIGIGGRSYLAHRVAWFMVHGAWPVDQIDHNNGIREDNRLANLREATNTQNAQNRPLQCHNKAAIKGVGRNTSSITWRARITIDGRARSLGSFTTKESAADAYRDAAEALFGAFARIE